MRRTFFFASALLPEGWRRDVRVEVSGGVIDRVSVGTAPESGDRQEALIVPGLPNVHSHAFQRAMAGLAERLGPEGTDDFWSWREVMYRFLGELEADDLEAIATYAYADMLEAGFTSVGEFHYLHRTSKGMLYDDPAELSLRHFAAAERTGIGLTLLPVLYESSNFGGVRPTAGQRRFITDLDTFARIVERVRKSAGDSPGRQVGIAPHSLRAVTFGHLTQLLGQYTEGPIHIHAAEQLREVEDCLSFCGLRPVEWLLRNAGLDNRWCIVHATHLTPEETTGLARSEAVVGLCPLTEANLGDGIFPSIPFRNAGGRWGIGTDSHIQLTAAGELRQLEYAQRLHFRTRNALATAERPSTGGCLYEGALAGGAQALEQRVGAIAPGYRADFLVLDDTHPDLVGRTGDTVLDTWVFAVDRRLIRAVIAAGHTVVDGHRHRDRERIDTDYRRAMVRLYRSA
ncbi:MAG: formimidoylglutamate deiminase [Steroidobacteraceae bacterium]